ncbi:MAG TPA: sulfide/dihydroorotate dehydrogenase-like FAD/NAD-binding protein [Sedimentisphaerales bacterium]|nr:sulfide/dihydroorotate dehydrogenase-like FAD/NAD-binding protein [Sedimentisphaerales bacterium]
MAHRIIEKRQLSENVFTAEIEAPLVARARKPGQFVIVTVSGDYSERIPLTIAGADPAKGTIRLIWQRVGKSTVEMSEMRVGDAIENIAGPLGRPTHIDKIGTVVCVGGGIGCAPLLPIATAMKEAGNKVISIIGARNRKLLILEQEFEHISDKIIVTTDDGSYKRKALVTEPLDEICGRPKKPDMAVVIGPAVMMKFCGEVTRKHAVPTVVSLNTIMIDGTGMCGGCRVEIGGETKFVCVDGPEFDGHKVDFDLMIRRLNAYKSLEEEAMKNYREHNCRIGLG